VSLQTDGKGNIISTPDDVAALLEHDSDFGALTTVFPVTGAGGIVTPFPRTQFEGGVGLSGSNTPPIYTLMTLRGGTFGNQYTLTINQPTTLNAVLEATLNGPDLVIDLATDASGAPATTVSQLATAIAGMSGSSNIFQYGTVSNFIVLSQNPSDIVTAQTLINLAGGGNGLITNILLTPPAGSTSGTADPDVVQMVPTAQALDTGITAAVLASGVNVIYQYLAALQTHFTLVGYAGGIQGFMTSNTILVHKNFSTLNTARIGATFLAANVFRPDVLLMATVEFSGTGLLFSAGTALGTATGNQSDTNFGPQQLTATVATAGVTGLALALTFTLTLLASDGTTKTSNPISFSVSSPVGAIVEITAAGSDNRFYAVTGATWTSGGSSGDQVIVNQVVERQITL
jgi:hypothetical protein